MTGQTTEITTDRLDEVTLRELARRTGEIWSVMLPATHPGAGNGNKATTLRALAHGAGVKPGETWLDRMEQLLVERQLTGGGPGVAIFADRDFDQVHLADITSPTIARGTTCHLLPLIREVQTRSEFLILGLSKKLVRLIRYANGVCTEMPLPENMPASLEEFHATEERERSAENHASASPAGAGKSGVRFGTKAEREANNEHMEHFFLAVDQEVSKSAGGMKVLLMGVVEEVSLFQRAAKKLTFMEGKITSGIRDLSLGEIALLAGPCALSEQTAREQSALERIREWGDRSRVETDLKRIVIAASGGQVEELCVSEQVAFGGLLTGIEEMANTAAVETLRHKGHVHVIAAAQLNGLGSALALLRF